MPKNPTVAVYLAALRHGRADEVERLRALILGAHPDLTEQIKWNAPSFHAGEHFATMRLGGKVPLQLILHLGARKSAIAREAIQDPSSLLKWLAPDRACIDFAEPGAVAAAADAIQAIVRQWVRHVPAPVAG